MTNPPDIAALIAALRSVTDRRGPNGSAARPYAAGPVRAIQPRSAEVTRLDPQREAEFQGWVQKWGIGDVDHPLSRYDYRGAFVAGQNPEIHHVDGRPHLPDTFKQHGHETFSQESKYSTGAGDGGTWDGDTFYPDRLQARKGTFGWKLGENGMEAQPAMLPGVVAHLKGTRGPR